MTWEIFLGIVAIVGFITAVATPIVKLISAITGLKHSIDELNVQMQKSDKRLDAISGKLDALKLDYELFKTRVCAEINISERGERI